MTAVVAVAATTAAASAQTARPLFMGDVVTSEGGTPLGHSMVTLVGAERQTFTSDAGVFAFAGIEPGRYHLRVTHIGYSPAELNVDVPEGAPPRVRVQLSHISIQLAAVKIVAAFICRQPGRPNPDLEPDLAEIVTQIRLNAEHYQLLSDSFPFQHKIQRVFYDVRSDSNRVNPRTDVVRTRSDFRDWEYKMGEVIVRDREGTVMKLPTLRDFASYEFLNNHCFQYGGLDSTRDGVFMRIAFEADAQIRTPDVDGTVYLDAKTFQIHRADLRLTKIPKDIPEVTGVRVTTIFKEISPSIAVIGEVHGTTMLRHWGWFSIVARTEDQRMFDLEWLRSDPAHPTTQP